MAMISEPMTCKIFGNIKHCAFIKFLCIQDVCVSVYVRVYGRARACVYVCACMRTLGVSVFLLQL